MNTVGRRHDLMELFLIIKVDLDRNVRQREKGERKEAG
jgi:hypothetical protein